MKKILSLLLVMLFIFAMGGGVYAENGDVDSIEYLCAVQTMPRQYTSLSHHYDRPLTGTGDDERNSIPLLNRLTYTVNSKSGLRYIRKARMTIPRWRAFSYLWTKAPRK